MKALTSLLLIATTLCNLMILIYVWIYGKVFLQESNLFILIGEIVLLILILAYAMRGFVMNIREKG